MMTKRRPARRGKGCFGCRCLELGPAMGRWRGGSFIAYISVIMGRLKIPYGIALFVMILAAPSFGREPKAGLPEDLGPAEIDVSSYPREYRETYRRIFLPVARFMGGPARLLNSPLIELDPGLEEAQRARRPELFSDPRVALVSRDGWRRRVDEFRRRPPCCGACPVLSLKDAQALWRFLVYDSIARKTGPRAGAWLRHRRALLERFEVVMEKERIR